ncbi:MAG: hypothetical protein KJ072_25040 [Verrucomicrobia bacterium]|nr:hypothetical protein [Verrucomicrobiota bacterium]
MQSLVQPDTMRSAALAAAITGLAGYPRLWLWTDRPNALWFMVALLVLTSFVLWSFVFAWYPPGTGQPALRRRLPPGEWLRAGLLGAAAAAVIALVVDPRLRLLKPDDFPDTIPAWIAGALFSLAFGQLFLCYAPLALFLRLFRNPVVAVLLTVLFGQFLLGLQLNAASFQADLPFTVMLLLLRALLGLAAAWLFLRGGLLLGTTWSLILESRLLFH